jgi:hypothetical protein
LVGGEAPLFCFLHSLQDMHSHSWSCNPNIMNEQLRECDCLLANGAPQQWT